MYVYDQNWLLIYVKITLEKQTSIGEQVGKMLQKHGENM